MDWHRVFLLYLWIAPHACLAVIATIFWTRGLHKVFPVFFSYVLYEIAEFFVLLTLAKLDLGNLYARVYLVTWVFSAALRFGVIQEIFGHVFQMEGRTITVAKSSLRWVTLGLVVLVIVSSMFASGGASTTIVGGSAWVGRGVSIIQCGLLLFLLLFSGLLGLSLRSYVFGIALGFGILSCVELACAAIRTGDISLPVTKIMNLLSTGGYHVAVCIWLGYLLASARTTVHEPELPGIDMAQWNCELERFLR